MDLVVNSVSSGRADFAGKLALVMKACAISRGQLASALAVDKSIVSRWLSGATLPSDHNLARATAFIAGFCPGFSMLDWEEDKPQLAERLGVRPPPAARASLGDSPGAVPDFAALPAFAASLHETSARGARYCGLWQSWMPTVGDPDRFHCEHLVIHRQGGWLGGYALGVSYRWPLVGFIANGQLLLLMSDTDDFVIRQFNRVDEPILDQVDGLMLAATSLKHQAPTACRVIMSRLLPPDANEAAIAQELAARAGDRCFLTADELPGAMAAALLPDTGARAAQAGGDRLLRADPTMALVKSRWF